MQATIVMANDCVEVTYLGTGNLKFIIGALAKEKESHVMIMYVWSFTCSLGPLGILVFNNNVPYIIIVRTILVDHLYSTTELATEQSIV